MIPNGGYVAVYGGLALAVMAFIRIFLMRQITDLRNDVARLEAHVSNLEAKYDQERKDKHRARNDVARAVMALDLVRRLAEQCTCGVLAPLTEIIDGMFDEFESLRHDRRATDHQGENP